MTIVLAVDGGSQQPSAIALASALARATGAPLIAANVYPWGPSAAKLGNAYAETVRADALSLLADVSAQLGELEHTTRAIPSLSPAKALHKLCAEEGADLLVIGSCHRGTVGRTLLGSVGDRVVHGLSCPVAIAPRDAKEVALQSIGVGVDGSPDSEVALRWARELAERTGGSVQALAVVEPFVVASPMGGLAYSMGDWIEAERERAAERVAAVGDGRVLEGLAVEQLAGAAADLDLLVVGSRGYGPIESIMLGSTGHGLAGRTPCPLVLVPRGAAARATPERALTEAMQ